VAEAGNRQLAGEIKMRDALRLSMHTSSYHRAWIFCAVLPIIYIRIC
jgi:hypothetical protein